MPFDPVLPRSFSTSGVRDHAPPVSGVYGLSSAREWIYVGESDNIQDALMRHLREPEAAVSKRLPTGFVFEVCDRASRPARQDRLIAEYSPACNRHWTGKS